MKTGKIVWLASYPKSGNTWMRAFLTALTVPDLHEVDINHMADTTIASSRQLFDEISGVASSDLLPEEIEKWRPCVYRQESDEAPSLVYHKIHDAWTLLPDGTPLIPAEATHAVLYIIRNPLDVAVSFANHLNTGMNKTIGIMNNPEYAFCERHDRLALQLVQKLLTWSGHVKSWVEDSHLPVCLLRYEDMKADPFKAFSGAVRFIGLEYDDEAIHKAIELSSFEKLKKQEQEKGFSEKNAHSANFFRKGQAGDWRNVLTPEQVNRVIEAHGEMMEKYGYKTV
jgi:hypothetical protein